jgi:hypothetical protein
MEKKIVVALSEEQLKTISGSLNMINDANKNATKKGKKEVERLEHIQKSMESGNGMAIHVTIGGGKEKPEVNSDQSAILEEVKQEKVKADATLAAYELIDGKIEDVVLTLITAAREVGAKYDIHNKIVDLIPED